MVNISNTAAISFFKIDVYPLQKIIKWFKSVHIYSILEKAYLSDLPSFSYFFSPFI